MFDLPDWSIYAFGVLFVFLLRIGGVAVGTVRILLTNRGMEWSSAVLGFIEVLVYTVGIGLVVKDLTDVPMLMSYCIGFSVGNILGIRIEQRMALGFVSLRVISRSKGTEIAQALRDEGYGATLSHGEGRDGAVGIVTTVIGRKHSRGAMRKVHAIDKDAFMVVDESRAVTRGWLPTNIGGAPVTTAPPLPTFDIDAVPEEPDAKDGNGDHSKQPRTA